MAGLAGHGADGRGLATVAALFWLWVVAARIFGLERVLRRLEARGHVETAWDLLSLSEMRKLRNDPTHTYTWEAGIAEVKLSELAFRAGAFEKAWSNASSALAILEWKGGGYEEPAARARDVLSACEEAIDDLRLTELQANLDTVRNQHFRVDELRWKESLRDRKLWPWKLVFPGRRPRLWDRLP